MWCKLHVWAAYVTPLTLSNIFRELVEDKDGLKKMPVRKFFNNTFGNILNDAIFELLKKQGKEKGNEEIFTVKGSVKFVAKFLQDNLPEWEREPDLYDANDDGDEIWH